MDLPARALRIPGRPPLDLCTQRPSPARVAARVAFNDGDAADWPDPRLRDRARMVDELTALVDKSPDLDAAERSSLLDVLHRHVDAFAAHPKAPDVSPSATATIPTPSDQRPLRQPARRLSPADVAVLKAEVDAMLAAGIIVPSTSPWASPVVLVTKPDSSKRVCVDYRPLNEATVRDAFPLPRIDDTLDRLGGSTFFSKIDLASGYWQVPMDPADQAKTAFITPFGLYEFTRMPFGLRNAPAAFQRLMTEVLGSLLYDFSLVYIDDIIIYSATYADHLKHISAVLDRLQAYGLHARISKSEFAAPSLLYLGYVVTRDGLKPNPAKVEAIKLLPPPANVPELRRFLGMTGYYRRFVAGYASIAEPLVALSRGNTPWSWTPACASAFETLRSHLCSAPVLAYPDWSRPFLLQTDASDVALGAVLAQVNDDGVEQPVAYASRTLSAPERNYSATDRECLAVVWAVGLHRPYLHGSPFTIVTDHSALTWLQRLKDPTGRLARWLLTLQEYDFQIVHKPGRQHTNADYLSRIVAPVSTDPEPASSALSPTDLAAAQRADPICLEYIAYLESGALPTERGRIRAVLSLATDMFLDDDGVLYHAAPKSSPRLVLPRALRNDVLHEAHDLPTAGHLGAVKTWQHVRDRYFWEGLYTDVTNYVRSCRVCQEKTHPRVPTPGPLQPLAPTAPWDTLAMDIFGPLPVSDNGRRFVLVFGDLFTKWVIAEPLISQDADTVARALVNRVISTFGCPRALLSDRGTNFTSALLRRVTDLLRVKRLFTTAYHPETDGQLERFMSTLQTMLSKFTGLNQRDWDTLLQQLIFAYNTRVHATTGFSPYRLLFGRDPLVPSALPPESDPDPSNKAEYVARLAATLELSTRLASDAIAESQVKQAARHGESHPPSALAIGDLVMLNHPHRTRGLSPKLQRPFRGPFVIVAFGPSPTTVRLAPTSGGPAFRHLVNVARLKLYRERPATLQVDPSPDTRPPTPTAPTLDDDPELGEDEFIVERILDHRPRGRGLQCLVRWHGFDDTHDSWEPARNIHPDLLTDYHARRPRTASP